MRDKEGSPRFDRDKFKALVHYIIWKCSDPAKFGATKLNKILWFADARAYMTTGKPITGETYVRRQFGPAPQHILPIRMELAAERKIRQRRKPTYGYDQDIIESLVDPDTSMFTREELVDVDYWVRVIVEDYTADTISEESHDYVWKIAKIGQPLPYYALFALRTRDPNEEELDWARKAARQRGLIN